MARSKHILMVLGSYDQSAHEGIARYAGQHGWHLNVSILKDFQLPEHWQGDGIITSLNNSRQLEEFIRGANVPVVDLSIWREDIPLPRVAADNRTIGRMGAEHFLELGHRHCAWFALATNAVSRTRRAAFVEVLKGAGIDCILMDDSRAKDPVVMKQRLQGLPKPCAIYTKSDYDSAWLANLCHDVGLKIPDEIAILGADDNTLICETQIVPLSSVKYDLEMIGYEGARLLDQIINGEKKEDSLKLIPPLGVTVRKSTDQLAVMDPLVRDVLEYLNHEYKRSIGTPMIAAKFGISRRSLEMRFREQMHCSIREYLIQVRVKRAKELLEQTEHPIETIAALTGFCHAPHFSSTFKRQVGFSPSAYRKR
ncbi:xylose operon transcription regulator XylR [Coraliomargarita akajimensis]|uniref:Transcriptional regulator, AraC family n=1 Tax=Coraliomargarita akajimensis (strain DSM 45221 / IAM 15411 / JCM 23193 / KCTC 12865 / 04OKA010-24) TaxID=583355 RepID=D5EHV0_CORAD|nr:DNA-binding transcriptional regulator [Coraliomargarita akajimensis]ADE54141.1 transcriptional regulator, AraC family [Coraliomargarita akajimensis DSM 45221]